MKATGLTLGKFAPLHKGHEHLIRSAAAQVDALVCVIYDSPEATPIPVEVRAAWLRRRFPDIEVIEARGGPQEVGDAPEIMRRHEEYLLRTLAGRRITHFFSGEFYGDHISRALNAEDCRFDPDRTTFPISGTAIRADPWLHRGFLDPIVYRDLVTHVVFLGAPSTGKSTLAEALSRTFDTAWMPEYGREYWEAHQIERRLTMTQLVEIAEGHREREERLLCDARGVLFIDTNALTTLQFSLYYHGAALQKLQEHADDCARRYDLTFVCDTDTPYDDTWDRSGDVNRREFQKRIVADLENRGIGYTLVRGSLPERIAAVRRTLAAFAKYPGASLL